jgi:hypothetical protein
VRRIRKKADLLLQSIACRAASHSYRGNRETYGEYEQLRAVPARQTWLIGQGKLSAREGCPLARVICVSRRSAMLKIVCRWRRRVVRAYELRCAREDAHVRNLAVPYGVWACHACPHVSLNLASFKHHLADVHA